jgi:ABC-type phosphate transport system substrate-binding protein
MKYLTSILLLLALPTFADVAVIINPDNPAQLNEKQVRSIFLSKTKFYPNGEEVRVYSLTSEQPATEVFNQKVLRKSQNSLNSYWARMLFSSKGYPPYELGGNETMRQQVANNKAAIGYIDSKFVDGSVKVLFVVKPD